MGCGASTASKYHVAVDDAATVEKTPERESEVKSEEAVAQAPSSQNDDELSMEYPLHVMKMSSFMSLEKMLPHNELKAMGLVVALDRHAAADANINFVSHQWLGFEEADPQGDHLRTMQEVFSIASGEDPTSVFKSGDEWEVYCKGTSKTASTLMAPPSMANAPGEVEPGLQANTPEGFRASVVDGYVWMDYISIPQTIGCKSDEELQRAIREQTLAIQAIPAYAASATNFWICCPSRAVHVDTGVSCGYDTWLERGWCRMEEAALLLTRYGDGRPLMVAHALGEKPCVTVPSVLERNQAFMQRKSAVLTGAFSCCRMGHQVRAAGSTESTTVPCDKSLLKPVLTALHARSLRMLRAQFENDPNHAGPLMECVGNSFKGDQSFFRYMMLRSIERRLLAESVDEPDWVANGWSKPFDELTVADVEAWVHDMYGLPLMINGAPHPELAWMCAGQGNMAMFRFLIERMGLDVEFAGGQGKGGTGLLNASRGGNHSIVEYICERCSPAHIDHQMSLAAGVPIGSLGALGVASFVGHAKSVAILAAHGAKLDAKLQTSGRTALHFAAEQGHADCVRALLEAGVDATSTDAAGHTALDVATATHYTSARYEETRRVLREWAPAAAGGPA